MFVSPARGLPRSIRRKRGYSSSCPAGLAAELDRAILPRLEAASPIYPSPPIHATPSIHHPPHHIIWSVCSVVLPPCPFVGCSYVLFEWVAVEVPPDGIWLHSISTVNDRVLSDSVLFRQQWGMEGRAGDNSGCWCGVALIESAVHHDRHCAYRRGS